MTAIEDDLTRVLAENGITSTAPDGMHSWRCEYPDRYGPCDCLAELVADLAPIVAAHVAAGQEQALLDAAEIADTYVPGWDEALMDVTELRTLAATYTTTKENDL